jgi:hypothetical protein
MFVFLSLLMTAAPAAAQTASSHSSSLSADRMTEVQTWMRAFTEWKRWWAEWRNRPEPGNWVTSRTRRQKPVPPAWLAEACGEWLDAGDPLTPACDLLTEWRDDDLTAIIREQLAQDAGERETPSRRAFWQNIHLDLLWPALEARTNVFGVAGTHISIPVKNRAQVFAAPGVMFVNLRTTGGVRVWKLATNYGIGFRLFDFVFPGGRAAEAHVNMARAWLLADTRDLVTGRTMDFVGFSVTFKKVR